MSYKKYLTCLLLLYNVGLIWTSPWRTYANDQGGKDRRSTNDEDSTLLPNHFRPKFSRYTPYQTEDSLPAPVYGRPLRRYRGNRPDQSIELEGPPLRIKNDKDDRKSFIRDRRPPDTRSSLRQLATEKSSSEKRSTSSEEVPRRPNFSRNKNRPIHKSQNSDETGRESQSTRSTKFRKSSEENLPEIGGDFEHRRGNDERGKFVTANRPTPLSKEKSSTELDEKIKSTESNSNLKEEPKSTSKKWKSDESTGRDSRDRLEKISDKAIGGRNSNENPSERTAESQTIHFREKATTVNEKNETTTLIPRQRYLPEDNILPDNITENVTKIMIMSNFSGNENETRKLSYTIGPKFPATVTEMRLETLQTEAPLVDEIKFRPDPLFHLRKNYTNSNGDKLSSSATNTLEISTRKSKIASKDESIEKKDESRETAHPHGKNDKSVEEKNKNETRNNKRAHAQFNGKKNEEITSQELNNRETKSFEQSPPRSSNNARAYTPNHRNFGRERGHSRDRDRDGMSGSSSAESTERINSNQHGRRRRPHSSDEEPIHDRHHSGFDGLLSGRPSGRTLESNNQFSRNRQTYPRADISANDGPPASVRHPAAPVKPPRMPQLQRPSSPPQIPPPPSNFFNNFAQTFPQFPGFPPAFPFTNFNAPTQYRSNSNDSPRLLI